MRHAHPVLLAALVAVLACVAVAAAATTKFTSPVAPFGASDAWEPSLVSCSDGALLAFATWSDGVPACDTCPDDPTIYAIQGASGFGPQQYLCPCNGTEFQADLVAVCDGSQRIHATWMERWTIVYSFSTDQGLSWSEPVVLSDPQVESDKNWIATSASGERIYVTFNARYPLVAYSTDRGATFTPPAPLREPDDVHYFYAGGAAVLSDGSIHFAYGAPLNGEDDGDPDGDNATISSTSSSSERRRRQIQQPHAAGTFGGANLPYENSTIFEVYSSYDGGATWSTATVDWCQFTQVCPDSAECGSPEEFLDGQMGMAKDAADVLYVLYQCNYDLSKPARILFAKTIAPGNWTVGVDVSDAPTDKNVFHDLPTIAAGNASDVRIMWMDNRTGSWNVYYRESTDGGSTWTPSIVLSTNYANKTKAEWQGDDGFMFPYGDYAMLLVDSQGVSHAIWGEGEGWYEGGGSFYTHSMSATDDDKPWYKSAWFWIVVGVAGVMAVVLCAAAIFAYVRHRQRQYETVGE